MENKDPRGGEFSMSRGKGFHRDKKVCSLLSNLVSLFDYSEASDIRVLRGDEYSESYLLVSVGARQDDWFLLGGAFPNPPSPKRKSE